MAKNNLDALIFSRASLANIFCMFIYENKGTLESVTLVTHHICDKNGFCSIHFYSQVFGYSSPVSSVDSPGFPGQLDTELNDLKGMHIRCFPVGFLVTMLQDLLPAVQLFPGLFTWDHYVIIHFMESH